VYIEFQVEQNQEGFVHQPQLLYMLKEQVDNWAMVNEIPYTSKYYKHTFRVAFDDDRHYTVFRLTWTKLPYLDYQIIDNKW
jgi:hypothetical protein